MWCEAGYPAETFWQQTQRSMFNAIAGAARANTKLAWMIAAMTAVAGVGKLKDLNEYLPADPETARKSANAKLLHGFRVLKERGVAVTIERLH